MSDRHRYVRRVIAWRKFWGEGKLSLVEEFVAALGTAEKGRMTDRQSKERKKRHRPSSSSSSEASLNAGKIIIPLRPLVLFASKRHRILTVSHFYTFHRIVLSSEYSAIIPLLLLLQPWLSLLLLVLLLSSTRSLWRRGREFRMDAWLDLIKTPWKQRPVRGRIGYSNSPFEWYGCYCCRTL